MVAGTPYVWTANFGAPFGYTGYGVTTDLHYVRCVR
jgi:hypothetical protein